MGIPYKRHSTRSRWLFKQVKQTNISKSQITNKSGSFCLLASIQRLDTMSYAITKKPDKQSTESSQRHCYYSRQYYIEYTGDNLDDHQ